MAIAGLVIAAAVLNAPAAAAEIRQTAPCAIADTAPGLDLRVMPTSLDFQQLWQFTRGAGQRVAVIDTGVTPNPRLRHLTSGGDLVNGGDGLEDCDAHGTLVAGIIAGAPDPDDGFSGLAPDAEIISIRQSSGKFSEYGAAEGEQEAPESAGSGSVRTLADAIRMATAAGATIINISEVACVPGPSGLRSDLLTSAIDEAVARDIVIVVAAGNSQGSNGAGCQQNPTQINPLDPLSRGWDAVNTDVTPANFEGKVLTVGSVEHDGSPSDFSIAGPWVSVAAPGSQMVSLANSRDGGLAAQIRTEQGVGAISGTSFSAPYVSGLAALIRARHPHLTAPQVIDRITRTAVSAAHRWDPVVGYGVVDPMAALSFDLPAGDITAAESTIAAPAVPTPEDPGPRRRAIAGVAVCTALLALGALSTTVLRRVRSQHSR
ncbi:type VII secretion-associated serine protease mycosin [Tomitella biformata]|uniref:type VII secretion-associated serine protease mycosin n=1 Tax=Tomitella biformata TaxID=630403 RepID=UPI00130DDA30|nr:type VII secretion-associated serine protease mycosin [Tomitella biformata]